MSDPGNVSEIQILAQESNRLSRAVDSWNSWYVWFGATALVVAFLVFFAQWRIIRKSKELALVQSDLIAAKDRQAASDSKDQDERIAVAQKQAADSNKAAAKANEAALQADERAQTAQASLASAEQHSAEADAKAEGFRADIAKANASAAQAQAQVAEAHRAAAEANRIAESERLARLQLEARLADRVITRDQQSRLTQAFASLKGQTIDVVIIGDTPEITDTANAIVGSIRAAGVLVNFVHPLSNSGARGVIIGVRKDASYAEKIAGDSFVLILRETLERGVGEDDFEKLDASKVASSGANDPGAGPIWQSPIRLLIASK